MVHSFLLIGQSNMAGRGFINEAHEIDCEHIYILRNGRWQKMFRPVCPDRATAGVCLAESFAQEYAKEYNVDVGLIPCADGGTTLNQWMPGEPLYDNAVFQAKLAMRHSTLKGVLWHQGESDCSDANSAAYKQRLEKIIAAFKADLQLDNIPFVVGGLGDFMGEFHKNDNYIIVNKALYDISKEQETVGFVSATGLKPNADILHFCSDALYEFGLRYYEEFKKLDKNPTENTNTPNASLERSKMELL